MISRYNKLHSESRKRKNNATLARQSLGPSRAKWLTQALIISGTFNIGLISTFVYFVLKDKQEALARAETHRLQRAL